MIFRSAIKTFRLTGKVNWNTILTVSDSPGCAVIVIPSFSANGLGTSACKAQHYYFLNTIVHYFDRCRWILLYYLLILISRIIALLFILSFFILIFKNERINIEKKTSGYNPDN